MKYLSLLILVGVVFGSWKLTKTASAIDVSVHEGLQGHLIQLIQAKVQELMPTAQNLKFNKLWTEAQSKDQVLAHFSYSFQEPGQINATTTLMGKVFLREEKETSNWLLEKIEMNGQVTEFETPEEINADSKVTE